jgi:glycosyltransferase involved in cell wall biosynthesis
MNNTLASQVREKYERPIIGIIGSSWPKDYNRADARAIGEILRRYVGSKSGTLFTGGVSGAGLDAYEGIVTACNRGKFLRRLKVQSDKFFVLVPEECEVFINPMNRGLGTMFVPYEVPEEYNLLAAATKDKQLDIVRAGTDMGERRRYVAEVGDVFVVINGGLGTLEEALFSIKNGKPVIASDTGGAAEILSRIKHNRPLSLLQKKEWSSLKLNLGIDRNLVYPISDPLALPKALDEVLSRHH